MSSGLLPLQGTICKAVYVSRLDHVQRSAACNAARLPLLCSLPTHAPTPHPPVDSPDGTSGPIKACLQLLGHHHLRQPRLRLQHSSGPQGMCSSLVAATMKARRQERAKEAGEPAPLTLLAAHTSAATPMPVTALPFCPPSHPPTTFNRRTSSVVKSRSCVSRCMVMLE